MTQYYNIRQSWLNRMELGKCPICGQNIHLTKITDDNRYVGSCEDAFTRIQWLDDQTPLVIKTYTPWGYPQGVLVICDFMYQVYTSSHGGVKVSPEKNLEIPEYMRNEHGWYEEDCDWAIPATVFEQEYLASIQDSTKQANAQEEIRKCLRHWHPDAYEKWHGVSVQEGESKLFGPDQEWEEESEEDFSYLDDMPWPVPLHANIKK